jgi:prepilin-type N-terminal cleavage/methylation domain-containing protein/prepilin-type processing-associated H-X9-DG protein
MSMTPTRRGLTLVETLVVIALVAVFLALLLPAMQAARAAASRAACANNLRQLGIALHQSHDATGHLPPGTSDGVRIPFPGMSWRTRLLPYLEQSAMWEQAVAAYTIEPLYTQKDPPHPSSKNVPPFACPSDARAGGGGKWGPGEMAYTSYLGVEGVSLFQTDGCFFANSTVRLADISDGTSATLLVGERPSTARAYGAWYAGGGQAGDGSADATLGVRERSLGNFTPGCSFGPYHYQPGRGDDPCASYHFWSYHAGGAHFLFADGSVRFLAYAIDARLPVLATRAGGEPAVE